MPRLGGGQLKQSYLISGGLSASMTQVIANEGELTPPSSGNVLRRLSTLSDHGHILPRSESPTESSNSTLSRRVRAAESGRGTLLPDYQHTTPAKSRIRTLSDMSNRSTDPDSPASEGGLRRRNTLTLDDESLHKLQRRHSVSAVLPLYSSNSSPASPSSQSRTSFSALSSIRNSCGVVNLLQAVVVCIIFYLVYDAHIKVKEAAHRLEHYKYEEAMLIDQMDRIEGRAMQLQEQLRRLRQINGEDSSESELAKTKLEAHTVEKDVFHWKRHFFEINKEVHALQDFMQDKARQDISSRYGSGTIQVNLNLATEEEGAPSQVTLELFDETPHAAWTFLQQIEKGDWKGASFIWHPSHMVLASPTKATSRKIEFVEKSHYEHEAWTVGLTPVVGGRYNLYINLQDNSHVHDGDVCLGKVVGGFDSLQQVLKAKTVAKQQGGDKTYLEKPIVINTMAISIVKRYGRRR